MSRQFSFQDKLALMMTSAQTKSALASFIGVSHQQIGRWLTIGQTDSVGNPSRVRVPTDKGILKAVNTAFSLHKSVCKEQAIVDQIPFDPSLPVFAVRTTYTDGTPGQRVEVVSTHRLSDDLRNRIIASYHETNFFHAISVSSKVRRIPYWFMAEQRLMRVSRDLDHEQMREWFAPDIDEDGEIVDSIVRVNTQYTPMSINFPVSAIIEDLGRKLSTRHMPAVGERGTVLADKMLFSTNKLDKYGVMNAEERRKRINRENMRRQRAKSKSKPKRR